MTNQTEISIREVQQDLGIVCLFLKSTDPARKEQAEPKLVELIERLWRDPVATRTKSGARFYDLLVRARENLRIGCVRDARTFLEAATHLTAVGWGASGEKAAE
jgi:hypothetical protein